MDIYNLNAGKENSDEFYEKSRYYAELLVNELKKELYMWVDQMNSFIETFRKYHMEILSEWYRPQPCEGSLELLLLYDTWMWYHGSIAKSSGKITYSSLVNMMEYVKETGEFKEEIVRWKVWMAYFISLNDAEWNKLWNDIYKVDRWIEENCNGEFDQFLENIDTFIMDCAENYADYALITRPISFYYLNILGAQILNALYQDAFLETDQKYIFLPGCMALNDEQGSKGTDLSHSRICKAKEEIDGYVCEHCSSECHINQIDSLMGSISVRIVYHESEMNNKKVPREQKMGVLGIACLLNLLSGGFKARRLGYIPQCVILDYPGCSHWRKEGTKGMKYRKMTHINATELLNRLEKKNYNEEKELEKG